MSNKIKKKIKCQIKELVRYVSRRQASRSDFRLHAAHSLPSIFGNPPTDGNDDVISLRVKSIGLFTDSLRPAGIRALRGGPLPDALSSRNRGNEVRIMIDLSERRATYDYGTT